MVAGWLVGLVVALGAATPPSGGLAAAAAASGRPRECAPGRGAHSRGPSIWRAARLPGLERYCDLLARAQAELATSPEAARMAAIQADELLPGRASPAAIRARAALAVGDLAEASRSFEQARALDPRAVEDPPTLHDLARVLRRTGKRAAALAVYRTLVPRIDLLASSERRVAVLLEAAYAAMAPEDGGGASHDAAQRARLEEALAYLREARQRPPTPLAGDVLVGLALALDRAGDRAASDAALAEAERAGKVMRADPAAYLTVPEDALALEALSKEATDHGGAARAWEAYLASPAGRGPWASAARARLEALRKPSNGQATRGEARPPAKKRRP